MNIPAVAAAQAKAEIHTADAPANLATEVYERLRSEIVEGRIRPNERLVEAELAERLQVSRTPVRESMTRLAADGLVVSRRRGWVVREHSRDEIREIYEVRAALEGYAARLAAERATDDMLQHIKSVHEHYIEALTKAERGSLVQHNDDFHDAVIAAAGNERLAQQIRSNTQYYFIHRMSGLLTYEDVQTSIAGHQELVDALLERDADLAERVARARVLEGLGKTLARLL